MSNRFAALADPEEIAAPAQTQPTKAAPAANKPKANGAPSNQAKKNNAGPRQTAAAAADRSSAGPAVDISTDPAQLGRAREPRQGKRGGAKNVKNDRHSNTDHTDTNRAVEAGWGSNKGSEELKAEVAGAADAHAESANGAQTPASVAAEDHTQTYEEWQASQKSASEEQKRSVRQAEESEKYTKNVSLLTAKEDGEFIKPKSLIEQATAVVASVTPKAIKKIFLDVESVPAKREQHGHKREPRQDNNNNRSDHPRRENREGESREGHRGPRDAQRGGPRRGRGGPRGAPRGGARGGHSDRQSERPVQKGPKVDVADTSAFPSLT